MRGMIGMDGSISVSDEETGLIQNMYPGIDGCSIHVQEMIRTEEEVFWKTADGEIYGSIGAETEKSVELLFELRNWQRKIHTFFFLYQAGIKVKGVYQAAERMCGDTGYYLLESLVEKGKIRSYGLCVLDYGTCALTIYSVMHDRYATIFELEPCAGAGGSGETELKLSCGARLEKTNGEQVAFAPVKLLVTDTVEEGLEQAAAEIGKNMNARLCMPPAYHWGSWYYCYHNFDMAQMREYLAGLKQFKPQIPIRYFQIDAGSFASAGDWLIMNERFQEGLETVFREIREAGCQPGIWLGPFMVGNRSRLYQEHPDWILYDCDGFPLRPWITDNEPKPWGYQDEEYYVLDTSHPDAMEYLRNIFATLRRWGAVMFKTDFMMWGLQDSSRVRRYTPGKTSVEYFRDFLQVVREAIGEESYWQGCTAPFLPFVGYADGMRIGGGIGSSWDGDFGPQNLLRCLTENNYANHNYYQTDPDSVMLRDFHIRLDEREIHSLALLAAVSGSCIYTSDPLHLLAEERRELFRFIQPDESRRKPSLPFLS